MKQRNTYMWERNGPRTGEVTVIFGLAYIRSKWALWGICYPTFQMAAITSNKDTCEPVARNSVTANQTALRNPRLPAQPSGLPAQLTRIARVSAFWTGGAMPRPLRERFAPAWERSRTGPSQFASTSKTSCFFFFIWIIFWCAQNLNLNKI
jgi:hypothetical protein